MNYKNSKKIKIAFFISSDGYGHTVRQSSIIKQLLINYKNYNLDIHIFGDDILKKIKFNLPNKINFHKNDNIIQTKKNMDGTLSILKTKKIFGKWKKIKKNLVDEIKIKIKGFDLVVSDSVPHVIDASSELGIYVINISHFTWDWFYKKTFKNDSIYKELSNSYQKANEFIFPPLTDHEILKKYKKKISNINFIITDSFVDSDTNIVNKKNLMRCIMMDNGSKVLSKKISNIIKYIENLDNLYFIICGSSFKKSQIDFLSKIKNCKIEKNLKKIHAYISSCDFLIARGGYNTITECLILNKPTLLYSEKKNKEVEGNINFLKKMKLTKEINDNFFTHSFKTQINNFISNNLKGIKNNFSKYRFNNNGSKQACKIIISRLS